ncbi:hypothetical protein [Nonomuraea sp. NPDC049158]|uniref:hypothetical protein n=1 Tax=Nonomuraea sp. NPDC049158 TaxID=3155649 RepID=UPI0033C0828E
MEEGQRPVGRPRYYERRGLIAQPARSPGGHRTPDLRERARTKIAEVDARIADLATSRTSEEN